MNKKYEWKASGRRFQTQLDAEQYLKWVKGCMPDMKPNRLGISEAEYKKRKKRGISGYI